MRTRVGVARALAVVSAACAVVDTVFTAKTEPLLSSATWTHHGWPLVTLTTLSCSVMGALIVSRHPRHPIGWLLIVAGLSSISLCAESFGLWALSGVPGRPVVAGHVARWVSALCGAPLAITAVLLIFLIAPAGRLLSPAWKWVGVAAVTGLVLYTSTVLSLSPTHFDVNEKDLGPGLSAVSAVGITLGTLSLVAAVCCLVIRLRASQGEARRQLLWIAASAAMLAASFVWFLTVEHLDPDRQKGASLVLLYAAYLSVPVCTAVAVLRHRLIEIDVIVNRALVVFLATALVSAAYVLVVVAAGALIGGGAGFWPSLLATAVVALAFQPLRRQVVRFADRLAFGPAAEPYDALAEFSRRLTDSPDPSDLLPAVADAAVSAVGARRAVVSLFLPIGGDRVVSWPVDASSGGGPTTTVLVASKGQPLGSLVVEAKPGRSLRSRDIALLGDLAEQAAIAFSNARLSAELAQRVAELDAQAHALEQSRRRLVATGDEERSRLEQAVSREVLPHLAPLPAILRHRTGEAAGTVTPDVVQPLRRQAEEALEALREITRGVYPAQLTRAGLEPALRSAVARCPGARLLLDPDDEPARSDPATEAAAYFCAVEALRALGPPADVTLARRDGGLRILVSAPDGGEVPIDTMQDRAEARGGTVVAHRAADGRLTLEVSLPEAAQPAEPACDLPRPAAAHSSSSRSGPNSALVR